MNKFLLRPLSHPVLRRSTLSLSAIKSRHFYQASRDYEDELEGVHVKVEAGPGCRTVYMARPRSGNWLTFEMIDEMQNKVNNYKTNAVSPLIFFASRNPHFFSSGFKPPYTRSLLMKASKLQRSLFALSAHQETFAVYDGRVKNSAYSLFSGCKYLFGSPTTKFSITSLKKGVVPLCGLGNAIANRASPAVARYLGISGQTLRGQEMYELGLITHYVGPEGHTVVEKIMRNAFDNSELSKRVQGNPVNLDVLETALNHMTLNFDPEFYDEDDELDEELFDDYDETDEITIDPSTDAEIDRLEDETAKLWEKEKEMVMSVEEELVIDNTVFGYKANEIRKKAEMVEETIKTNSLKAPRSMSLTRDEIIEYFGPDLLKCEEEEEEEDEEGDEDVEEETTAIEEPEPVKIVNPLLSGIDPRYFEMTGMNPLTNESEEEAEMQRRAARKAEEHELDLLAGTGVPIDHWGIFGKVLIEDLEKQPQFGRLMKYPPSDIQLQPKGDYASKNIMNPLNPITLQLIEHCFDTATLEESRVRLKALVENPQGANLKGTAEGMHIQKWAAKCLMNMDQIDGLNPVALRQWFMLTQDEASKNRFFTDVGNEEQFMLDPVWSQSQRTQKSFDATVSNMDLRKQKENHQSSPLSKEHVDKINQRLANWLSRPRDDQTDSVS